MKVYVNKLNNFQLILIFCSAFFFILYSYLYFFNSKISFVGIAGKQPSHLIFNQPDESINYLFIRNFVLNSSFKIFEPLSEISLNQVHPRSVTVVNGNLVPIGFPGVIVIYGVITKLFTTIFGDIFFNFFALGITQFLAVITPWFFYGFLRRVVTESTAKVSALLLFLMPFWWYYAGRSFQHNLLFIFCIIVGLYFFEKFKFEEKQSEIYFGFYALFMSLAIFIRPFEIIWLLPANLFVLFINRKKIKLEFLRLPVLLVFLVASLFFITNLAFYGHPFGTGYAKPTSEGAGTFFSKPQGLTFFKVILAPFGFHPFSILKNTYKYLYSLFPLWTFFALGGFFFALKKRIKINHYIFLYFCLTLYLLAIYGSWNFNDNLSGVASIGSSYARYFLVIYVFAIPFISNFLLTVKSWNKVGKILVIFIVAILLTESVWGVYFKFEGLNLVQKTINDYSLWQKKILLVVPENGVIVTRYADKYIFPHRKIIPGFGTNEQKNAIVNLIANEIPVFFFDLEMTDADLQQISDNLAEFGLILEDVKLKLDNLELRPIGLEK